MNRGLVVAHMCESAPEINPFKRPTMTPVLAQFIA